MKKTFYIILVIILFAGTSAQKKENTTIFTQPVPVKLFIDSIEIKSKQVDKEADIKTDLLINQKRKLQAENVNLKKEILKLNLLLIQKPDTVYLALESPKKDNFFRRLFKKRKEVKETLNDY